MLLGVLQRGRRVRAGVIASALARASAMAAGIALLANEFLGDAALLALLRCGATQC